VVIVLRYGLGYSPAAIALMLELPTGTVNSRLARALNDLRERERERDAERT
jgi:DNA-directed RNA polymerase specialized sigma24 family protein